VKAFIGLAAAPDFTRDIKAQMTDDQKRVIENQGYFEVPHDYGDKPYVFTHLLLEDGEDHCLLDKPIPITCPVRLIQGMKDSDVAWQTAHRISNAIIGSDKKVYLREEGDHSLSSSADLDLLTKLVMEFAG
jgi:hypothetical protein